MAGVITVVENSGQFQVCLLYTSNVVLPEGKDYTFWGKGVSQGHSDAVRRIAGVKDAKQYTIPVESAPVSYTHLEYFKVADDVVGMIKLELGKKISDTLYISLIDPIYMAVQRSEKGIQVRNAMMWDIQRFYPEEFHLGEKALGMIQKKMNVSLLQDEAAFIALHIVNASADGSDMTKVLEITKLIGEIAVSYTHLLQELPHN